MILKAIIEARVHNLDVPEQLLAEAGGFFDQLDRDMDRGWQMSREWVDHPDQLQRGRIVADKLLTALETDNRRLGLLMAGYLLQRLPGLTAVEIDTEGEIQNTGFTFQEPPAAVADVAPAPAAAGPAGLSKLAAMTQAGQDVTKVFKVGKGWRFSVYDHASASWQDSPLIASEDEAERMRELAVKARYEALQRGA